MVDFPDLQADCTACQALCCMALAFDEGEKFAASKSAGQPCRHLVDGGRCGIHKNLAREGYQGCIDFTCQGAGQRLVAEVFAGQDWRDTPRLRLSMMDGLRRLRQVHELLVLLKAAMALPLSVDVKHQTIGLVQKLSPDGSASQIWLDRLDLPRLKDDVMAHLKTLAPFAQGLTPKTPDAPNKGDQETR